MYRYHSMCLLLAYMSSAECSLSSVSVRSSHITCNVPIIPSLQLFPSLHISKYYKVWCKQKILKSYAFLKGISCINAYSWTENLKQSLAHWHEMIIDDKPYISLLISIAPLIFFESVLALPGNTCSLHLLERLRSNWWGVCKFLIFSPSYTLLKQFGTVTEH